MLEEQIQPQAIYEDRRGSKYRVSSIAQQIQTDEMLVVYQEMFGEFRMLACPVDAFRISMQKPKGETEEDLEVSEAAKQHKPVGGQEKMMAFLDTRDFEEKANLLKDMYVSNELTNAIIDNLAAALDVVVEEGDLQWRYEHLRTCVETRMKFETLRLR